jgi:hypothetical protein
MQHLKDCLTLNPMQQLMQSAKEYDGETIRFTFGFKPYGLPSPSFFNRVSLLRSLYILCGTFLVVGEIGKAWFGPHLHCSRWVLWRHRGG